MEERSVLADASDDLAALIVGGVLVVLGGVLLLMSRRAYRRRDLRAAAVAGSPPFEARRILTSGRVDTNRERWLAARALVKIRLYRAGRMLNAMIEGADSQPSRHWNRKSDSTVEQREKN